MKLSRDHRDTRSGQAVHVLPGSVNAPMSGVGHLPEDHPGCEWLAAIYPDGKLRPLAPENCEPISTTTERNTR